MMKITLYLLIMLQSCFILAQNQGDMDPNFNVMGGFGFPGGQNPYVYALTLQEDGKIYAGGSFQYYNGIESLDIARLDVDGNYDNSFNVGTGIEGGVKEIKVLDDGKILVIGGYTSYNGTQANSIIRLNNDGTVDTTFNSGSGFDREIGSIGTHCAAFQADGKMLIGGNFDSYNGTPVGELVRLFPDGTLDTSFQVDGFYMNRNLETIVVQNDGKILVGGDFDFPVQNGDYLRAIVRFLPDGSVDPTFEVGEGFNNPTGNTKIHSILVLPDDKLLIGGRFTEYNGMGMKGIVRLNLDGSVDPSFHQMNQSNNISVHKLALQDDKKILVGGVFEQYDGMPFSRFVRLDPNGFVDTTFNIGNGFNDITDNIVIQTDGKIIVSGQFTYYNGVRSRGILRLMGTSILNVNDFKSNTIKIYPNPVNTLLHFDEPLKKIKIFNIIGSVVFSSEDPLIDLDVSKFQSGSYILKAVSIDGHVVQAKLIKE